MRGVANQMVLLKPTSRVTMKTSRQDLTGIRWRWCHVSDLVIISLVFINLIVTNCIALKNSNAAKSKLQVRTNIFYQAINILNLKNWIPFSQHMLDISTFSNGISTDRRYPFFWAWCDCNHLWAFAIKPYF